jgi:hypothetical protein
MARISVREKLQQPFLAGAYFDGSSSQRHGVSARSLALV